MRSDELLKEMAVSASARRGGEAHTGWRRAIRNVLLVALGVYLICAAACSAPIGGLPTPAPTQTPSPSADPLNGTAIIRENQQAGTDAWRVDRGHQATTQIQAYASDVSVQAGDTLTFYVSVQADGDAYTLAIYRLGWYGGLGGRLMYTTDQVGVAQGYYDAATQRIVDCATCQFDGATDMIDADWNPSVRVGIPAAWLTGVYLAKLTEGNGYETTVSFDVRGDPNSAYLAVTSDTTVAAYNTWGGHSFYMGIGTGEASWNSRAKKVSLNRPVAGTGLAQGLLYEIDTIRWMERLGYDVSYMSNIDLDLRPNSLDTHRAFISLGHDEYWSAKMRAVVTHARDTGIGLAFIGANDIYWQIRFERDNHDVSDRVIVCYKNPGIDPLYQKDNAHLTTQWRDPLVGQPENSVIGIMYSANTSQPHGYPWYLGPDVSAPLLDGTGLIPGQPYGCDIVGYEWDRVAKNGRTPANLQVIGASPTVDYHNNQPDTSNTAYYIAPSGALVFDAGTIAFSYALDDLRLLENADCAGQNDVVPGLQRLMENVMRALVIRHPRVGATAQPAAPTATP